MKTSIQNRIKKNNGFTGTDLSISIMVIMISVSVIATLYYNLYFAGTGMKRNVVATDYAINILETIEAQEYSLVTFNAEEDSSLELKSILDNLLKVNGNIQDNQYITNVSNYNITVKIEKYSDRFAVTENKEDYLKIITVTIEYNLGKKSNKQVNTEKLEISTLKTIN